MSIKPKLFRDPVHDIIALRKDSAEDRVLLDLVSTRELQRLRRIRQLGLTNLVYHGAEHSRFQHSMGVMSFAGQMYDQLRPKGPPGERLAVVAAALCHDLGHGPFSHVAERIGGFHHEDVTVQLIQSPASEVNEVLRGYDPGLPTRVAGFYDAENTSEPLRHIVSSQLDADRMDYIRRDGIATGVKIGVFDTERILGMLEEQGGGVCVSFRAVEAVEGYLLARFHMYKQVYLHKACRAAERMLEAAFRRANRLRSEGYPFDWYPTGALASLVQGELVGPRDIPRLDDIDIWYALKRWSQETDPALRRLSEGLVSRDLFKTLPMEAGEEADLMERAKGVASSMGLDPEDHILVDSSADTPYKPYLPGSGRSDQCIRIVQRDGRVAPIEDVSAVVGLLGQLHYHVKRLVAPAEVIDRLR